LRRWSKKFPKSHKFTIGDRIETTALDVLEAPIEAAYTKECSQHLRRANLGIEKLRFLLQLAADLCDISRLSNRTIIFIIGLHNEFRETSMMLGKAVHANPVRNVIGLGRLTLLRQSHRGRKSHAALRPPPRAILAKRNAPFYTSEISGLRRGFVSGAKVVAFRT